MTFKSLVLTGDRFACYKYRVEQPFNEMKRFGVEYTPTPILPLFASQVNVPELRRLVREHDIVILQRVIEYTKIKLMRDICFLENRKLLLETDDDYLHLEHHNPCYFSTALGNPLLDHARELQRAGAHEELQKIMPELEVIRKEGLEGYKRALPLFDAITVTTEELAQTLRVYNKNVHVFPNQMERTWNFRDYDLENCDENGKFHAVNLMGMRNIPSLFLHRNPETLEPILRDGAPVLDRVVRLAYSGTASHLADWSTITRPWNMLAYKWADRAHFVYIGDPWFYFQQRYYTGPYKGEHDEGCPGAIVPQACGCGFNPTGDNRTMRRQHIAETTPDLYLINLKNVDIGVCPLEPTIFNMGKSDLKAMEYASWGACPVVPRYCTYARTWKDKENCLMYSNEKEFYHCIEYLLTHHAEREQLGRNARLYVENNRLEKHHTQRRYDFYRGIIDSNKIPVSVTPNKVKNENSK